MKNIKRKIEVFSFYDKTGIERHLEKMAEDGWLLEKISALFWTYRRIEPKKIRFSISYYATINDFEPEPTEEQQEFNEFCEHSGWKLAAASVQMQIFYNENEDPVPIETDPLLELDNLHRYAKKTALRTYPILLFLSFIMGGAFIGSLFQDPVYYLSSAINLFTGVWFIVAFIYSVTEIGGYYIWRRRAKALAEQGEFLETKGHRWLVITVFLFMVLSLALYVLSIGNKGLQMFTITFVVNVIAVIFIVQAVKELLKRKKVKAGINRTVVAIISFVVSVALMSGTNVLTIYTIKNDMLKDQFAELPFTIGELTGIDDSDYLKSNADRNSILLRQIDSTQHPMDNGEGISLGYTITEVKLPFMYDFCFEKLYDSRITKYSYEAGIRYEEVDAAAWGAEKAYQLIDNGKPENTYLVCYDRYFLQIIADWNLTQEQKQIISASIQKSYCDIVIQK